jgi:protein O-mannosyl-transferase
MNEPKKVYIFFICLFLLISTFFVYSQVQYYDFINLDDPLYITENLNLKEGLTPESFIWAFTTSYDGNWFPITWLSHLLDYHLFGINPQGHHLTSLLFHIANVLILFIVLFRMTGALWKSAFVATLFAFHPINIESVAWVAERKNVLSSFFWMLTLLAYSYYVRKANLINYSFVVLFFVLGLMSKAMLVTLPFVLLLVDYWPLDRFKKIKTYKLFRLKNHSSFNYLLLEKIPLLILSLGSCITTFILQKNGGSVRPEDLFSLQARIINSLVSYVKYLELMVLPKDMSIFYPHPGDLPILKGVIFGIILFLITFIVLKRVHRMPYLPIGWFWYLGTLVPVIGLVQVGGQAMADRYAYIPLIGIFIMVVWGLSQLMEKWRHRYKVLIFLSLIYIPTLMVLTWNQLNHWKNSISIFSHAISVTKDEYPDFALVHNNLGRALRHKNIDLAIQHYNKAIMINPRYALPHYNLGNALYKEKHIEEAISHFESSIRLNPNFYNSHYNLGTALLNKGRVDDAIRHFMIAIKLKPDFADTYFNLGAALLSQQNVEEAIIQYKAAIKLKPNFPVAHLNLGHALYKNSNYEDAILHYRTALKLNPNLTVAKGSLKRAINKLELDLLPQ